MPTRSHGTCYVSTSCVLTFPLNMACQRRGARQSKAATLLAEIFVASIGQVPHGVCLTTMVPTRRGRQLVRCIWEANDVANRGRCSVDATLAVEEACPTRGLRHEAVVFHWRDTTEASKDQHQLRTGSSRRFVLRRFCRIQLQKRDRRSRCELCRVESPYVREFLCTTDMYFC